MERKEGDSLMEFSSEYFLECIEALGRLVCGIGGCKTIDELISGQENTLDIKTINIQGRD